tara:strand:- start:1313 stop:1570 length:258 start_codon:yes stop_codon:yes gene_type:complete
LISKTALVLLGVPIGLSIGLTVPSVVEQITAEPMLVNVVCESFEGKQGVAGKDGKDGLDGNIRFTHVPELDGLFHEQNVKIEYHD